MVDVRNEAGKKVGKATRVSSWALVNRHTLKEGRIVDGKEVEFATEDGWSINEDDAIVCSKTLKSDVIICRPRSGSFDSKGIKMKNIFNGSFSRDNTFYVFCKDQSGQTTAVVDEHGITHMKNTVPGDCGSPVYVLVNNHWFLVGIHHWGSGAGNSADVISKDTIDRLISKNSVGGVSAPRQ